MNETFIEKLKTFLHKNVMICAIAIGCLVYVITGMIAIKESGKTLIEIVGESLIVFTFSFFIIESFSLQGILNGKQNVVFLNALKKHSDIKSTVMQKSELLNEWVNNKNFTFLNQVKNEFLINYGLSLEKINTENFDISVLTEKQKKAISKANRIKISKLTMVQLLNENSKKNDPLYLGKNIQSYMKDSNISTIFTKVIFTLIFGYFSTSFISFSIADIIWKLLQIVFFIIVGIIEYYKSYMFICGDYVEVLNKKTDFLNEYIEYVDKINGGSKNEEIKQEN